MHIIAPERTRGYQMEEIKQERFVITDDKAADWAIEKIAEHEADRDRLINLANSKIEELQMQIEKVNARCETETSYLKSCLSEYFLGLPKKSTKTQTSYKLLAGTLVFKKPSQKIAHDDKVLIEALKGTEYIKVKESVDWAGFKKNLTIADNKVVDAATGEVVEGCSVEEVPGEFIVKVGN